MKEMEGLAERLSRAHHERKQKHEKVQFVNGTERGNSSHVSAGTKRSAESYPQPQKYIRPQPHSTGFNRSSAASLYSVANTWNSYDANRYQDKNYYSNINKPDFVSLASYFNRRSTERTSSKKRNVTVNLPSLQGKFQAAADSLTQARPSRAAVPDALKKCARAQKMLVSGEVTAAVSGNGLRCFMCRLSIKKVRVAISGMFPNRRQAIKDAYFKAYAKLTGGRWELRPVDGGCGVECWTPDERDSSSGPGVMPNADGGGGVVHQDDSNQEANTSTDDVAVKKTRLALDPLSAPLLRRFKVLAVKLNKRNVLKRARQLLKRYTRAPLMPISHEWHVIVAAVLGKPKHGFVCKLSINDVRMAVSSVHARSSDAEYDACVKTITKLTSGKWELRTVDGGGLECWSPDDGDSDVSSPGVTLSAGGQMGENRQDDSNQENNVSTDAVADEKPNLTEGPPPPHLQSKFQDLADTLAKSGGARTSVRETLNNCTSALNVTISLDIAAGVLDKAQHGFVCRLSMDDVRMAVSRVHAKRKDAVNDAYVEANAVLTSGRWRLRTVDGGGGLECYTVDEGDSPGPAVMMSVDQPKTLDVALQGFVLVERPQEKPKPTAARILLNSANFCKKKFRFQFSDKRCTVLLEEVVLAEAEGSTKNRSKRAASMEALKRLRPMVNTLKIKKVVVPEGDLVSRDGLNVDGTEKAIGEDNVGSKLLRQMGWAGGGLGKFQSGIVEPVKAQQTFGREGVGLFDQVTQEFIEKVTAIIREYAASESMNDLVFAPGFSSQERAKMHQIAHRFHLKSKGSGGKCPLTVSRMCSSAQIVDHVCCHGGQTDKYELLPPSQPLK